MLRTRFIRVNFTVIFIPIAVSKRERNSVASDVGVKSQWMHFSKLEFQVPKGGGGEKRN